MPDDLTRQKQLIRERLRRLRRAHVAALPDSTRALLFRRPPNPVTALIPPGATIGLYRATPHEAPTAAYARFFLEADHPIALPRFASRASAMEFRRFGDPFDESDLERGPFGLLQPPAEADVTVPDVMFVPLVGFSADGHRLGQGGGYYDRWLAEHPDTLAIGLAWDCQLVDRLPTGVHDRLLTAIVTPTRLYGPI